MTTYTVEKTYLLPNYRHVTLEADSPADAARLALADDNDSADWKHDYDCARPEEVTGVWIGEEPILTFGLPGARRRDPVRGPGVGAGARVGRHHPEV